MVYASKLLYSAYDEGNTLSQELLQCDLTTLNRSHDYLPI